LRFDGRDQAAASRMWEQALTFARATGNSDLAGDIVADFAYRAL